MAKRKKSLSIAVIGGGIAGVSAAWALHRSGFEVSVFEKAPSIGGNARTFNWKLEDGSVDTGIFVLAWPTNYYHSYNQLLDLLGVKSEVMPIRYFIKHPGGIFAQDGNTAFHRRMVPQFNRWTQLLRFVKKTNALFTPSMKHNDHKSLYHFSYTNPMNFTPLYALMRLFGISDEFWDNVFVPMHCSTFITTEMKDIPAVIGPLLEEIVPLETSTKMSTWCGSPRDVFDRMTSGFADCVYPSHEITSVKRSGAGMEIRDREGRSYRADRVVFACNSSAALEAIDAPTLLQRTILSQVSYVDDTDPTFVNATLHTDTSILPEEHRQRIIDDYNTYTEVQPDGTLECTFVLSSHLPVLRGQTKKMMVTFNSKKPIGEIQGRISIPKANHSLSLKNMALMSAVRTIQGQNGIYFCGSFTTPEGGHDLSLLSGWVVARELGADYPLNHDNRAAVGDFHQLQRLMLGRTTTLSV